MTQVTGVVEKVYSKEFKPGKFMYSLIIGGTFYGAGGRKPSATEGDNVKFEASQNGKYWNIEGNVEILSGGASAVGGGASYTPPAQNDRQLFEERKQTAIALQSARNTALTAVGLLLQAGTIKLPAKATDGADVIIALADELTTKYFEEVQSIYRGEKPRTAGGSAPAASGKVDDFEDDISF